MSEPDACNFCGADGFEIDELNPHKFPLYPNEPSWVCDYCKATYLN